jgi:hypothetical protein
MIARGSGDEAVVAGFPGWVLSSFSSSMKSAESSSWFSFSFEPAMKILAVRLGSLFDLLDRHFHAETFQLADQALALLVPVPVLEIIAP